MRRDAAPYAGRRASRITGFPDDGWGVPPKRRAFRHMQITETSADGLRREFKVVVPAEDIEKQLEGRLRELGQTVRLPGFRPGKVPLPLLKQRYGQSVLGEILEKAVSD